MKYKIGDKVWFSFMQGIKESTIERIDNINIGYKVIGRDIYIDERCLFKTRNEAIDSEIRYWEGRMVFHNNEMHNIKEKLHELHESK